MKILAIGNSFSDDSMEYLYPVLLALGEKDISLGNLYIGGCPIDRHVANARESTPDYDYRTNTQNEWHTLSGHTSLAAIRSQTWDVITMQQASYDSGRAETYGGLSKLIGFVDENATGMPKLLWNMTWAYQSDTTHAGFANYGNDQMAMYNGIVNAVKTRVLPTQRFAAVIPVGTAIQNARTSYLGDTLTRDGFHLSIPYGRYIAALTWGRILTGKTVRGISYEPDGVDEKMKAVAIEAVENAIVSPFEIKEIVL